MLRGPILLYYQDDRSADPKGVFLLDGSTVKKHGRIAPRNFLTNGSLGTAHSLTVIRPNGGGQYEFCADSPADLDRWVHAICATGACTRAPDGKHGAGLAAQAPPPESDVQAKRHN